MLVGPKELFLSIADGVVRNFVILANFKEPLVAVRIMVSVKTSVMRQRNL